MSRIDVGKRGGPHVEWRHAGGERVHGIRQEGAPPDRQLDGVPRPVGFFRRFHFLDRSRFTDRGFHHIHERVLAEYFPFAHVGDEAVVAVFQALPDHDDAVHIERVLRLEVGDFQEGVCRHQAELFIQALIEIGNHPEMSPLAGVVDGGEHHVQHFSRPDDAERLGRAEYRETADHDQGMNILGGGFRSHFDLAVDLVGGHQTQVFDGHIQSIRIDRDNLVERLIKT